nr:DUF429 domain-containing protein [Xylanimonas oleitrophica]
MGRVRLGRPRLLRRGHRPPWVTSTDRQVIEIHPEVSFATMAGRHMAHPKSTWAGTEERKQALAAHGIVVPAQLGLAGRRAAVDDVLDAAAACWSTARFCAGEAVSYPDPPERFDDGIPAAIWA